MSLEPFHKHAIINQDLQDISFRSRLSGEMIKLYLFESIENWVKEMKV